MKFQNKIPFSKVVNLGIDESQSVIFNDRLKLLNIFTLLCVLFATPYYIALSVWGEWLMASLFVVAQILFTLSLVLNHTKNYNLAKILILITTNYVVLALCLCFGHEAGFYLYYFTSPLIAFSLFGFDQLKKIVVVTIFYLSSFVIVEYLNTIEFPPIITVSGNIQLILRSMNGLMALSFLSILTYSLSKNHFEASSKLIESNNDLFSKKNDLNILLKEKDVLLAEIHHRVKNNLAIISSLFNLQINYTSNEEIKEILKNSSGRIKSMSMIHESLYQHKNLSKIDFKLYLEKLVRDIEYSYGFDIQKVNFIYNITEIALELEKAVPCGILTNEIITNAFKHAFNEQESGTVKIGFNANETHYELSIEDSGIGIDLTQDSHEQTLGMTLIHTLIDQIDGTMEITVDKGTKYKIVFPID